MQSGPRMMYQTQSVAFNARDNILGKPTDSTPTTPPSVPEIDLEALCRLKWDVVNNLPVNCFHCGAEYPRDVVGTFVELSDGCVMAYCKKKGACGRSHVLFAGVDLVRPIYEQVCPFSYGEETNFVPPPKNLQRQQEIQQEQQQQMVSTEDEQKQQITLSEPEIQQEQQQDIQQILSTEAEQTQQITQSELVASVFRDFSNLSQDQMMEMHDPTCRKCGKRKLAHHNDVDKNGWRIARRELLSVPVDWPVYNRSKGTWSARKDTCSIE